MSYHKTKNVEVTYTSDLSKTESHLLCTVIRVCSYPYRIDPVAGCHVWEGPFQRICGSDFPVFRSAGLRRAEFKRTGEYVLRNLWIGKHGYPGKGIKITTTCGNRLCINLDHACPQRIESSTGAELVIDDLTNQPISKQRKYQLRRQREGNCQQCGKPANGHAHCPECIAKRAAKLRRSA